MWVYEYQRDLQISETYSTTDGSYTITGLPSGKYRVWVNRLGPSEQIYKGVYKTEEATPVIVSAPNNSPDIDFVLSSYGSISGHVYHGDGISQVAGADIYVYEPDMTQVGCGKSGGDSSYTTRPWLPSEYRYIIKVSAIGYATEYYNGVYSPDDAMPLVIGAQEILDIDFSLDVEKVPPTVTAVSPAVGASMISTDAVIQATFSETMNKYEAECAFSILPVILRRAINCLHFWIQLFSIPA